MTNTRRDKLPSTAFEQSVADWRLRSKPTYVKVFIPKDTAYSTVCINAELEHSLIGI